MTIRVGDRVRIVAGKRAELLPLSTKLVGLLGTVYVIDDEDQPLGYEVQLDGDPADCPTPFDRDELVYTS